MIKKIHTGDEEESLIVDRRLSWHLDRSINLPFILSMFMLLLAAFGYVQVQDRRMTRNEMEILALHQMDENIKNDMKTIKADLREDLARIESKIDQINSKR